ncbi:MAG: AzlD domain-containing protein [Clostridiales bacterium]|jgi:branched-subunit amino acid transport protein|nr:AzlD domain-containing protein [Eubacteriales bacterium]MDH7566716.1 AzlD domain-containing protein [Clostridiales bacterium]
MNNGMLIAILGAAVATYFTRFPLMILSGRKEIPPRLVKYMSFIAPAVLTALIVPAVFAKQGRLDISLSNHYIIAAAATILVSYFSKNMLASIITGICTVGLLTWIF